MSVWKKEEVLVIVKAYPTPSKKYGETVCTAGITKEGKWIRLYPVQFRDLPNDKQYKKFNWIEANVTPAQETLRRWESHRIDEETIKITGFLEAGRKWPEREKYFIPMVSSSLEKLMTLRDSRKASLGAFKPKKVIDFRIEKGEGSWSEKQLAALEQQTIFGQSKTTLEKIPYTFHYKFLCDDSSCNGHDLTIIDWELIQSYRNFKKEYGDEETTLEMVKKKWFDYFFIERESYFVVGTDSRFNRFMIIGVVSPRRKEAQMSLGI